MLSAAVDRYLAARRAVGFQLQDTEDILRDFVAFASGRADTHVCSRTVLDWIRSRNGSPLRKCIRLRTVSLLARYLHAEDERHEVPPQGAFGRHKPQRRPPFLFTPADVEALIRAARRLGPDRSLQHHVYGTLFGLLASTGLRISEALNLQIEDVTRNGLLVRNTKFGKSRLLPLYRGGATSGRGKGGAEVPRRGVLSRARLSRLCSFSKAHGSSNLPPSAINQRLAAPGRPRSRSRRPGFAARDRTPASAQAVEADGADGEHLVLRLG